MPRSDRQRQRYYDEFRREMALDRFREEKPQLWLQYQRCLKLIEIQERLDDKVFPRGHCFLHSNTVSQSHFCVRRVTGIDLDTSQITLEIYGDDELEDGIVVLPLETVEWFGFPANAVPVGVHFQGFTGVPAKPATTPSAGEPPATATARAISRPPEA